MLKLSNKVPMLIATLLFIILTTESATNYLKHVCPNTTTYTPNSTYQTNLIFLLSSLSSNSAQNATVFHNSTAGQTTPDIAYGLFLCRGDVTAAVCRDCVATATGEILTRCPNQKSALVWYNECMLRYDNNAFFSTVDFEPTIFVMDTAKITEQTRFLQVLGETMDELANRASIDNSNDEFVKGFATQEANFTSLQRLYELVQCTQDLSNEGCNLCIRIAINNLRQRYTGSQGGRVLLPSCNVRYEIYPFYGQLVTAPPPSSLPPAPSSLTRTRARAASLLIKGLLGTFGAAIGILIIAVFSLRRKIAKKWRKKTENYRIEENFLPNYGSLAPKRYRYTDIKKMTNSFKDKIGEGGYGSVYKGKLCNGSLVAVKVLKESKGNGEEFFNEVASISRTSHVNVVTLLGFCFKGRKRALVYEFMPNGSLDKFIYNEISSTNRQLGWDKSYRIAIGIARGLEYLHRGCSTRILHFDIKPHNILLDEDFVPKISDFGLAKLCPGKESTVSMLNARGTIGYIAPEVYCRNFGRVSHKSDVYSYGMMVLELVGGRKNIEVEVGQSSEIYFPDWIYKKLESDKELGMYGIMNEDENVYARKMIIVSLWCIQSDPSTRPSMSKVVEMLEGSLESLKIPPKPVLSSPHLSPSHSSSIEIS